MKHFINLSLAFTLVYSFNPATAKALVETAPIAEVVKLRGEITQLSPGARLARKVELGDKFVEDTSIVTGAKSFIKIKFVDNSELNIGPESKIVITEMKKEAVGIISLLKGRIRTEVQKDLKDPTSNKFFIKTRTAAMGVRGTDFQTLYNPENKMTSLLTYKGEVAMVKVDELTYDRLENAPTTEVVRDELTKEPSIVKTPGKKLDKTEELNKLLKTKFTVLVPSGQNAFSNDSLKKTSLPVNISPVQFEALYKNSEFQEKSAENLNLKSATELENAKTTLKVTKQTVAAEGLYNEKTGDFAPKSGGFIDMNTGLYIAPGIDAKIDAKSGVYIPTKIGEIDGDTGQYVAPKGLVLDAKKGFVLAEAADSKTKTAPELLALREDLNKNIAKDIVVGTEALETEVAFDINEKFIRDRIHFSIWGMDQTIEANKNGTNAPYQEIHSNGAVRFAFEWQMATNNRFGPLVGIDYSIVGFDSRFGFSQESKKLMGLSFGTQYALNKTFNLYAKLGLHQDHYLDQTANGMNNTYNLKRVVLTRLSLGGNAEFWKKKKFSLNASAGGLFTFRKRINNLIINEGLGLQIEVLPKYALSERKWIGLGLKIENQSQRIDGTVGINRTSRKSGGLELKYISEF